MKSIKQILAIAALLWGGSSLTLAQSTAFTYQGRLTDAAVPADGMYEFRFVLYDAASSGSRVSNFITNAPVTVRNGLFTTSMDFGTGPFTGVARWLEIAARTNGSSGNFVALTPRQLLTATPLALRAAVASNADQLNGQGPGAYVAAAGDTMTGTLVLPANGLRAGTDQLVLSGGNVGIGTSSPSYPLHLSDTAQIMERIVSSHTAGTWQELENTSTGGKRWSILTTGSGNGEGAGHLLLRASTDGRTIMTLKGTGNVGIGTTAPETRLQIDGGTDTTPSGGGYLVLGSTAGLNISVDNNELQACNNGVAATMAINASGGNVNLIQSGSGKVGIGTAGPRVKLEVVTSGVESAIYGSGGEVGMAGWGAAAGAYFGDSNGTGEAWLGTVESTTASTRSCGVLGQAYHVGGAFSSTQNGTIAYLADRTITIWGTGNKQFVQNHPLDRDKVITYTCLEGDETGTYTRGSGQLVDGEARIALSETFKWVTNPDVGLTAHLTPRGQAVPLAVVSLTTEELVVRGPKGSPDVAFDYIVNGLRIGFEESSVVRPKEMEAWIPSMASQEETYAEHPELRKFNALERFKAMRPATQGKAMALDLSRAATLRGAITVYDPAVHQIPHPPRPGGSAVAAGASAETIAPSAVADTAPASKGQATSAQGGEVQELRSRVDALEKLVAQLAAAKGAR